MKKYFVYYSFTGFGEEIANLFKEKGYELLKIKTEKDLGKSGFFKMIKLGASTISKKEMRIKPVELTLEEGDLVVIGAPIWNDRIATPMRTFLNSFLLNKETTEFVLYSGGGEQKHATKLIEKLGYKKTPIDIKGSRKALDDAKKALERF